MRIKTFTLLTLALFVMSVVAIAQKPNLRQSRVPQVPQGLQLQHPGQVKKANMSAVKLPKLNLSQETQMGKAFSDKVKPFIKKKASNRADAAASSSYSYGFAQAMNGWTTIDADGDGYDWYLLTATITTDILGHDGEPGLATSASYASGALNPDNYLVSPKMKLDGSITFYASAQDAEWASEHFGVAVSTTSATDPAAFTMVQEWDMTAAPALAAPVANAPAGAFRSARRAQGAWYKYEIDLSGYAGAEGYVAIRHFGCTDWFRLNVDDITLTTSELLADYDPDLEQQPESGLVTPPDGLKTTEWALNCFEVTFDGDGNASYTEYTTNVNVGVDAANGEVYVQGLCPYVPEGWIMGTLSSSGTEVTFDQGQFFGTYDDTYDFFFFGADEEFNSQDVVMSFDAANSVMSMTSPAYAVIYYTDYSGAEGSFVLSGVTLSAIADVAATPAAPTLDLDYGIDWNTFSYYYYLTYDIPTTDVDGNPILSSNLSYQFYVDVDQEVSPLTLTTDLYTGLDEDMTVIPYGFTDNLDVYPNALILNMNFDSWRRVGIQSIYTGGGEERRSEIVWYAMYWYPVSVAAQSYATFYIDEPVLLDADDAELGAEMLAVTAVTDGAVTTTKLDAVDGNTPLLIYNGSDEKMNIYLIPTDAPGLELALAPEFKGTLEEKTFSAAEMEQADHYVLNQNMFVWVRDAGTVKPSKCWLEIDNGVDAKAPAYLEIIRGGGTTGIGTVHSSTFNVQGSTYYDLQGRRLTGTPSKAGIYIQNGKKFVIK